MLRYHFEIRKKPNQLRTNLAHAWTDSLSTHFSCHCSLFFVTRALSATLQPSHCIARNSFFLCYHYISCNHMCVVTWNEIHLGHLWIFIETLQLHTYWLRKILLFSLDFTFSSFYWFWWFSACFWTLFGVVFDTWESLFVNMCSIGESFEFEWIPGREGWSPKSWDPRKWRVKGSSVGVSTTEQTESSKIESKQRM